MTRFSNKTVLISGAARGQGRAHALQFAREGAHVVAFDVCAPNPSSGIDLATRDDLDETVRLIHAGGGSVLAVVADVREAESVVGVIKEGVSQFGGLDIVVANAGIVGKPALSWETSEQVFRDVFDVDLLGVWTTVSLGVKAMLDAGTRGSVIVTGSGASLKGLPHILPYVVAKHGLVGLVRTMARELGPHGIRINAVLPGNANTAMFNNDAMRHIFVPEQADPEEALFLARAAATVPMRVPYVQPSDVTEAVCFLASDAARYLTGVLLPVDGGTAIP
jgi:SDR family mycofactocin-dependent oxidoreductase